MAADMDAIESAVRGVIEGTYGAVRTVPANRLRPSGSADRSVIAKSLYSKTYDRYELDVRDLGTHPASPPKNYNKQLSNVEAVVTIWTRLRHPQRQKATRATRTRTAAATAQLVRDALEYSGNLDAGDASAATGIIRGSFEQVASTPIREFSEEQISEQALTFRGIVLETLAVS